MWLKWKLVLISLEIVLILMQDRCLVCTECAIGSEIVLAYPMELLGDVVQVEARFGLLVKGVNLGLFEIVLTSTQDRCMVCVEHAIGLEIILGAPDGTPR
jgi:hypothetical protein